MVNTLFTPIDNANRLRKFYTLKGIIYIIPELSGKRGFDWTKLTSIGLIITARAITITSYYF